MLSRRIGVTGAAVICLSFLVGASHAQQMSRGFEWHGIKSGMTKKELRKFLDLDALAGIEKKQYSFYEDKTTEEMMDMYFKEGIPTEHTKGLSGDEAYQVIFHFTDEDRLWSLGLKYKLPVDPLKRMGLRMALEKEYGKTSVKEETYTHPVGTVHYFLVTLIDSKLASDAIDRYSEGYKKKR